MSHNVRVLIIGLFAAGFTLFNAFVHYDEGSLSYDEGDYYRAVLNGFWANWTDSDDVPISDFVSTGVKAVKGEIPRSDLSKKIRAANSSAFLRHYHPPVAFYPPIIVRAVAPDLSEEKQLRVGTYGLMLLWIGLFVFLGIRHPELFSPWLVIIPASANWIASTCGFNMHILFGLAFATTMLCWYAYEKDRNRSYAKHLGIFFLALTLCSVEYSLFLICILGLWSVITFWRLKGKRRAFLRIRLVDGLWLLGWMTLFWPGGTLKLGLLKSYAIQAYVALFRLGEAGSSFDSFMEMLWWKWSDSALEIAVFVAVVLIVLWGWRELLKRGSLFVAMLLVLMINYLQMNPVLNLRWYLFPAFATVFLFLLHVLSERYHLSRAREVYSAVGLGILFFVVAQFTITLPSYTTARDVRDLVKSLPDAPIIAIQGITPSVAAYFPNRVVRGFHRPDFDRPEIQDSLSIWAQDHILIITQDVEVEAKRVGTIDDLYIYAP